MIRLIATAVVLLSLGACGGGSGDGRSTPTPSSPPAGASGWEIGPRIDGRNYSSGAALIPGGEGATIPLAPGHINLLSRATGRLTGKTGIRIAYRIEASPGTSFDPKCCPGSPAILTLFVQRRGDDWSARGKFEAYRWWATSKPITPVLPGDGVLEARFDDLWTAVLTSNSFDSPDAFRAALADPARIGISFGGGDGFGHGINASAPAKIIITSWELY